MKKATLLLIIIALLAGCDQDFEQINTNPTAANDIDPTFLFSTVLLQSAGTPFQNQGAVLAYTSCFVQHLAAVTTNWEGDKYLFNSFHNDAMFVDGYRNEVKTLVALLEKIKDDPDQTNLYAAARIWEAVIFQRMTDLYGDIPYSEAGRGFLDSNFKPVYDQQEDIYLSLLDKLEAATLAFDDSKPFVGDADFIFHGNLEKWRRFGNSIMLRLALRLVNVDPVAAEVWAKKAINGGLMQSLDDSALVPHSEGEQLLQNGIGSVLVVEDNGRLAKTFVDWMKVHNDPRLTLISSVATGTEPKGLPHGLDLGTLTEQTGDTTLESYSRINKNLVQLATPTMIQGYAEAEFMLAEAALHGWINDDPSVHYENGVRAAIQQLKLLDASATIVDTLIEAYIAANPFQPNTTEEALELINTQYWAATFLNGLEAFANWRRSGYPVLIPANFPGNLTGGIIPRRLLYPQVEFSVNEENINVAIARQGENIFTTKVWWDK